MLSTNKQVNIVESKNPGCYRKITKLGDIFLFWTIKIGWASVIITICQFYRNEHKSENEFYSSRANSYDIQFGEANCNILLAQTQ